MPSSCFGEDMSMSRKAILAEEPALGIYPPGSYLTSNDL